MIIELRITTKKGATGVITGSMDARMEQIVASRKPFFMATGGNFPGTKDQRIELKPYYRRTTSDKLVLFCHEA